MTTNRTRNQDRTNTHIQDDVDGHNGRTVVCGNIFSFFINGYTRGRLSGPLMVMLPLLLLLSSLCLVL